MAASKCKACGAKFKRKPIPPGIKLTAAVLALSIPIWVGVSLVVPSLTDPEQKLTRIAKQIAEGPKKPEDAKRLHEEFDHTVRSYLSRVGQQSNEVLAQRLNKIFPASAFEVHVFDLPRGLKVVEIDAHLQASDYLVMKSGSGTKVFSLAGVEVFDDARILNESAGPMLVLLAHTAGQPPHRPQIRVYGLMPDDISDETDKLLPAIRGEGTAKFAANGRDVVLDLSLASLGQSERLFANVSDADDSVAHQHLGWKDAHYLSRYDYGTGPFTALYAVARCLRYPDLLPSHARFLGSAGEQLVRANKSPESGDYRVKRLSKTADKITYRLEGTPVSFDAEVSKSGGVWSITAAKSLSDQAKKTAATAVAPATKPTPAVSAAPAPAEPAGKANTSAKPPAKTAVTKETAPSVAKSKEPAKSHVQQATAPQAAPIIVRAPSIQTAPDRHQKPTSAEPPNKGGAPVPAAAPPKSGQMVPAVPPPKPETAQKSTHPAAEQRHPPDEKKPEPVAPVTGMEHAEISRRISSTTVNLRAAPSTVARPVGEVQKGATIEVLGKQDGWYRVRHQGREGYIYGALVDYKKGEAYTTAVMTKTGTVTDAQRKPLGQSQAGDRVVILSGIENGKYKVRLSSGKIGYVEKDALDVAIEAPPEVP